MYLASRKEVILLYLNFITICSTSSTLKLVQIIFRHGISTPENSYPTDPSKNNSLPSLQSGQLTEEGVKAQRNLGRSIASRYTQFINGSFKRDDIKILSSDFQKTISSADVFLASLFESNYSTGLHKNLIEVIPSENDNILCFCKKCSKHQQLENEVLYRYSVRHALQEDRDIFDYMSFHSGLDIKTINDFSDLYSTLYYQIFSNMTVPHWVDSLFESGALDRILSVILRVPTSTNQLKRLRGGPILKMLMTNMSAIVNALNPNVSKLQVFSGHGDTLITVLDCLDLFDGSLPSFSSAIILELHQDPMTMNFHVEIFSNINSGKLTEFNQLWIPMCGLTCPWSTLYQILNPFLIVDFDLECQTATFPWNALLSAFILLAAFPILLVFFIKILEKRRTDEEFSPLLNSHKIF